MEAEPEHDGGGDEDGAASEREERLVDGARCAGQPAGNRAASSKSFSPPAAPYRSTGSAQLPRTSPTPAPAAAAATDRRYPGTSTLAQERPLGTCLRSETHPYGSADLTGSAEVHCRLSGGRRSQLALGWFSDGGVASTTLSLPPWNGSTGSTNVGSSKTTAASHPAIRSPLLTSRELTPRG